MAIKSKKGAIRNRKFFAKDFQSFKQDLLSNARTFFPDKIADFSEPSIGGLLLDMASVVGDSLTYYLDHSFRELDPDFAVEVTNIENHVRSSGVKITGAAPASVNLTFTITVPSEKIDGEFFPKLSSLPVILAGTVTSSAAGATFVLAKDLNFSKKNSSGNFLASFSVRSVSPSGEPDFFDMSLTGLAVSGREATQIVPCAGFTPFKTITIENANVSTILSVADDDGNEYYEVESLSQDSVFVSVENASKDSADVSHNVELKAAPYRYITRTSLATRTTTLLFGSGDADVYDDDIMPDPSDVALELFGKETFNKFAIDPNALLRTQTLGISPTNTNLTIRYRYGGGLDHNVSADSIKDISNLVLEFRNSPIANDALSVRQSIRVNNSFPARGGADAPSIGILRSRIRSARNSQRRIVTKEDLLARVYSMPSQFGSVFRASVEKNIANPLSSILYVCSLDSEKNISVSPDSLKDNLSTYLNEHRLISDAVDILDVKVINFGVKYEIIARENTDRISLIETINSDLAASLQRDFFQIGQPVVIDDIVNIIINHTDVISLSSLRVYPRFGQVEGRQYSDASFPFEENTKSGILRGPKGSIFELRFPGRDISGTAL